MSDRITCVLVNLFAWGHIVMPFIKSKHSVLNISAGASHHRVTPHNWLVHVFIKAKNVWCVARHVKNLDKKYLKSWHWLKYFVGRFGNCNILLDVSATFKYSFEARFNISTNHVSSWREQLHFLSFAEEGNSSRWNVQQNILASVNFFNIFYLHVFIIQHICTMPINHLKGYLSSLHNKYVSCKICRSSRFSQNSRKMLHNQAFSSVKCVKFVA